MPTSRKAKLVKTVPSAAHASTGDKRSDVSAPIRLSQEALAGIGGSRIEAFNMVLLREAVGTIWVSTKEEKGQTELVRAAIAALKGFKPADEIEGMLAAQAVALHFAAMECFRRSMISEQPGDAASKLRRDGANLARAMTEMVEALDRKRGKGPQVVRVERVVVQDGGKAIVGNVSQGAEPLPMAALEAAPTVPTLDLRARATPGGRGEV